MRFFALLLTVGCSFDLDELLESEPVTGTWAGDCDLVAADETDLIPLIEAELALTDEGGDIEGSAVLSTFDDEGRAEEIIEADLEGSHEGDNVLLDLLTEDPEGAITFDLIVDGDVMDGRMDAEALGEGKPADPHYDCVFERVSQ